MTDWKVRSQSFGNDDKSWLGSAFGVDMGRPIELDLAAFDFVTDFPNGWLPSGIVLGKFAGSDKFGHYDPGTVVHESWSIAVDATGGTWTISFDGETSAAVAFNVSAANLLAALEAMSNVDAGDFTVTGGPGAAGGATPYVVTATAAGQYGDQNLPNATTDAGSLTGGAGTAAVTTTGGGGTGAGTVDAGLAVARGHLLMPVDCTALLTQAAVTSGPVTAALMSIGRIVEANLPSAHRLDDAAKAALPHIEYV